MPKVTFMPSGIVIEVPSNTSLFSSARQAGLPVASSCNQEFVCGKCNMQIIDGKESLTKQTERERSLLLNQGRDESDRISCVTRVVGDCVVAASYW